MKEDLSILVGCLIISFAILISSFSIGISKIDVQQLNNTQLKINISDLYVTGNLSANLPYGEMWFHNDTTESVTVIGSAGVYYQVEGLKGNQESFGYNVNGFEFNEGNLTALISGKYKVDYHITGTDGANTRWHAVIFVNNFEYENTESHERVSSITDVMQMSGSGFIDLIVGDNVSLYVKNEDTNSDLNVVSVDVNLIRIGN